jgi:hypothetical protein
MRTQCLVTMLTQLNNVLLDAAWAIFEIHDASVLPN